MAGSGRREASGGRRKEEGGKEEGGKQEGGIRGSEKECTRKP